MKPVIAPLTIGDQGSKVASLQDALRLFVERKQLSISEADAKSLLAKLADERKQQSYGDAATSQLVKLFQTQSQLPVTGTVDQATADAINQLLKSLSLLDATPPSQFFVHGQVTHANGAPAPDLVVRAFDKDLRSEEHLCDDGTTEQGMFQLRYTADQFRRTEKKTADLIIRVYDAKKNLLATSPIHFNAGADEVINLSVPNVGHVRSELERYLEELNPVLGEVSLPELTSDDLDFLTGETGINRDHLYWMSLAAQFALTTVREDRVRMEMYGRGHGEPGIPLEAFYGWFRRGLPADLNGLWAMPTNTLLAALRAAIDQQIIPPISSATQEGIQAQIEKLKLDRVLQAPAASGPARLGDLLATLPAPLTPDQQRALAGAVASLRPDDPKLVEQIAKLPGFDGDAVAVARTLRLGALTGGNLPLTEALQPHLTKEREGALAPLTALRPDQWLDLVYTHGTPSDQAITPADYADALASRVEEQHPTAALGVHFADGRRLAQQPALNDVGVFLQDNPSFDIVTANLNAVKDQSNLDNVADSDRLVDGLRALQRLNVLGANWNETAVLVENNLLTPQHILAAGPTQLTNLLDGQIAPERVVDFYDQAVELHGVTFAALTAALSPLSGPYILPDTQVGASGGGGDAINPDDGGDTGAMVRTSGRSVARAVDPGSTVQLKDLSGVLKSRGKQFDPGKYKAPPAVRDKIPRGNLSDILVHQPTLQSLFGSQDACSCDHCSSVLSPAAYFVDVLQFISNAKVLDRLLARRPDLQDIELTCNNSNTEVPAIDMALEILENAVALPLVVEFPAGTDIQAQLTGATVGAAVQAALKRTVRSLAGTARATREGGDWTVVDGHRRWKLTAQIQEGIKTATTTGGTGFLNTAGMNLADTITAFDQGNVAKGAESAFASLFAAYRNAPPDFTNYKVTIKPLVAGQSWQVRYQFKAQLVLDTKKNQLTLQTQGGDVWWEGDYNAKTITAMGWDLKEGVVPKLVRQLLAARFFGSSKLALTQTDAKSNIWTITSLWIEQTLTFLPTRLTIASLAYQSGDPDADALAWPENYDPEAYRKLNNATFPWSLPLDLPLETVRLFLKRAHSSREALMRAMAPVDRVLRDDQTFTIEVLGSSASEAKLISPAAAPSADDVYANWGIPAGTTSVWDAAAAKAVSGAALDILKNVSIVLQQSRLSFEDMQAVIATKFVSQGGTAALRIDPPGTCKPSEMNLTPLTPAHLDRIYRFVRLQRRLGWSIQEVDTAIQTITPGVLNGDTLKGLADLVQLIELLQSPVDSILALWNAATTPTDKSLLLTSVLSLASDELQQAQALLGVADPLSSIAAALEFCQRVTELQRSGMAFEDLRYVLQHQETPGSSTNLDDSQLTEYARVARDAVGKIPDPPATFPPPAAGDPATIAASLALRLSREDAVIAALATVLGAARELVDDLLRIRLRHPADATKPAIGVFLEAAFLTADPAQPPSAAVKGVLVRLYKVALILNALNVKPAQLSLLRTSTTDVNGLITIDFNTLPLAAAAAPANVVAFEQLLTLVTLSGAPWRAGSLLHHYAALDFTDAAIAQNAQQLIAIGLSVDSEQVKQAAKQLHIATADQYRDPQAVARLIELLAALKQLRATVDQVSRQTALQPDQPNGLISPSPNDMDADAARELLRAKYGESQWHDLIKAIADKLRVLQRDALVDYLIARDRLRDANDLYERYLIDVQTGSCMATTRLLQATAAAQLFVQRVLLNLEPGASFNDDQRNMWDWMQSYRVWEANRKVFLFPENWLLPELRDDKSSTFSAMEGVLTQQEPSLETTRDALLSYLDDLGELAQIKVIAMYDDRRITDVVKQTEERTLYVIGRTPNQPFRYFWRSCEAFGDTKMSWTGWEALELDNANDFIMPFVLQGDLHVAWPTFRMANAATKAADPLWDVQLNWKRHDNHGWVKSKVSHDTLTTTRLLGLTELRSFVFQIRKGDALIPLASNLHQQFIAIDCYTAIEGATIKTYTPDLSKVDQAPTHGPDQPPSIGGWNNVFLTISSVVYESYQLKSTDPVVYQPAKFASVTVDYVVVINEYQLNQQDLPLVFALVTDSEGRFSFDVPMVKNGSDVKLTFKRKNSSTTDTRAASMVDRSDPNNPQAYKYWTWNTTYIFPIDPPADTPYGADRPVTFLQPSGTFWLVPGRDAKALNPSNGPDLLGEGDPSQPDVPQRLSNGFTLSKGVKTLQLPNNGVLEVDHAFGEVQIARAAAPTAVDSFRADEVWHLQDDAGPYYLASTNDGWSVWPDGQDFVESYRDLAAGSPFAIFVPAIQATPRDIPPKLSPPPPPPTGLQTTSPTISFDRTMPYANYNWELFLHAPLAIADFLASQQRFSDARRWLHAVFDPTTNDTINSVPQFWRFLPFRNDAQPDAIATLLTWLADPDSGHPEVEHKLTTDIEEWKENPFMPHLVARLRPSAYQWYSYFAYLDVLIGWGDQLFRRDTRESVNEATLLYVLASKLLGPRPRTIPPSTTPPPQTYRSLRANSLDDFSNAWLSYSDLAGTKRLAKKSRPVQGSSSQQTTNRANPGAKPTSEIQILTSLSGLAFCIPQNDKLVGYYDLIDQRLFNIRHCRNIDGIYRDLPLYDPPIDPLLLIRARAAGLDIESVVAGPIVPLPSYRFSFTLQKALELCSEVKALGAALLAAIEKQDAEDLALLRSSQEVAMLKLVRDVRQRQVDEAAANIVALQQSQATVMERFNQFQKLLGKSSMTTGQDGSPVVEQSSALTVSTDAVGEAGTLGLSRREINQLSLSAVANEFTQIANSMHVLAGILSIIPDFWAGDPVVGQTFGGSNLGSAAGAIAKAIEMGAVNASYLANQMGTFGGYERRQDDWVYQSRLALAEFKQLDKQILAATIRQDIAQHELDNHDTQIENATAIDDFLRSKFTSQQLHRWMSSQIAQVYFSTYQLALDQARRAELAYRHELGVDAASSQFVQSDYWDNLKRGLLAGEHLHHDLKRMESAYLERNTREFEITKHISLLQLNAFAFIQLKETGSCDFDVPEALFDLDFPGHYFRRIKMVSLSIPCVAGPYVSVSATLKLNKSQTRVKSDEDPYKRLPEAEDDPRFTKTISAITAIVTSSAQQDSGMFEPNLRDERYLPFEGSGVISSWTLTLPDKFRPFDYDTISDVLLHFRYTARDGGDDLKTASEGDLDSALKNVQLQSDKTGLARLFSLRHEFPTEWYRFLHPQADYVGDQILTVALVKERLSFLFSQTTINLQAIELYVRIDADFADSYTDTTLKLALKAGTTASATPLDINIDGLTGLLHAEKSPASGSLGNWTLTAWLDGTPHLRLDPDAIQDIFLVCRYTCTST